MVTIVLKRHSKTSPPLSTVVPRSQMSTPAWVASRVEVTLLAAVATAEPASYTVPTGRKSVTWGRPESSWPAKSTRTFQQTRSPGP